MNNRLRLEHARFLKVRAIEAEFVNEMVKKANHENTKENIRNAEWAQRKFLEKYQSEWRQYLPQKGVG